MEIKVEVHAVHPSTSYKHKQTGTPTGPRGSWCTPDDTPKHVPISKTTSNIETKTIKDDSANNKPKPIQKVRLFESQFLPRRVKLSPALAESMTELHDLDKSITDKLSKIEPVLTKKAEPVLEKPQSPVPGSVSKEKEKLGFKAFPSFCDPYMPIDPQGRLYISWLFLVTFCYVYNSWCIPLRASFPYQTPESTPIWMTADYFCDFIYLLDVVFVKPRLMFVNEGFWVDDPVETKKNYKKKLHYKFDVTSLLPLDILYLYFGSDKVILRFPRLLKLQTFWAFHRTMDRVLSSPYVVRIGKTLFYIFYLIHLNACAYYAMSNHTGLGSNSWVYDNVGNAYLRCFYFATKTATSIVPRSDNLDPSVPGKNPKPENTAEYLFMTAAWLMGVFVFALLIGQIRDIIATATKAKTDYRNRIDGCTRFMRKLNMPANLQRRVACWFHYTWNQQRCFDESRILNSLPYNMKRDVALEVHIKTLSKVQLFRDCSSSLLRDLVLQLRPVSYLPGDVVVRRGDVGHQMYIIKNGECNVMSPDEREILATLREGSVFGEISLLGIDGLRRRTATVRSRGYSSLFALSRNDLDTALKYHKEAAQILRIRADQIIQENAARQTRQKIEKENAERHLRRRKSAVSGDIQEEKRKMRSTSSPSISELSSVSEDESLSIVLSGEKNVIPQIILSND